MDEYLKKKGMAYADQHAQLYELVGAVFKDDWTGLLHAFVCGYQAAEKDLKDPMNKLRCVLDDAINEIEKLKRALPERTKGQKPRIGPCDRETIVTLKGKLMTNKEPQLSTTDELIWICTCLAIIFICALSLYTSNTL